MSPPHSLPLRLNSFVGREPEIAAIKRLLSTSRLLTLTGPPGAGKTLLARCTPTILPNAQVTITTAGHWGLLYHPINTPRFACCRRLAPVL